jgi:2-keto-3-deoxy-L-rhamnonate aldolase RhmA
LYSRGEASQIMEEANNKTFIAVQAESRQGVDNADAIAAVEGVDCVFAGPFDLSVDLGIPAQLEHPDEVAAIDKMMAACAARGKAPGILIFEQPLLRKWIEKGMRFVVYQSDMSLLADAAVKAVAELKSAVQ